MTKKLFFVVRLLLCQPLLAQQPVTGDVNGDGKVDRTDIMRGVQIAIGQPPPASQSEIDAGDLNRDGRITVQDLVLIRSTIAGGNRPPVADASASPDSGLAGTDIQLDATRSFDLDGDALTYRWRQLHMNRFSTEYITENKVTLRDSTSVTPTFRPEWPGNYRFEMQVREVTGLVDKDTVEVLVRKEGVRQLDVKGITFFDFFGENGGPQFDPLPDDPDSLAEVQNRAMAAPLRVNAEWISFNPAAWYARINPLPEIRAADNNLSLTSESDYAAIVSAAKSKGLKVFHQEQLAQGALPLRPGEMDSLVILMESSAAWWERWFTEWKNYILPRADLAQKYGVDMLVVYQHIGETFRPSVYPQYGERWREIIAAVRLRYSGKISLQLGFLGTSFPEGFTFADALDALIIFVDGGHYVFWFAQQIADINDPTLSEIRTITETIFDSHEQAIGNQLPVYYNFNAVSANGQPFFFPAPPLSELDYREQVIYYEAFSRALEDETWVTGFISHFWSWFNGLERPGTIWDEFTGVSPRDKPAEGVVKLWFGIY